MKAWLINLGLKKKLMGLSCFLLFMLAMNVGISLHYMTQIGEEFGEVVHEDIPATRLVTELANLQLEQSILFEKMLFLSASSNDPSYLNKVLDKFNSLSLRYNRTLAQADELVSQVLSHATGTLREEFEIVQGGLEDMSKHHEGYTSKVNVFFGSTDSAASIDLIEREQENINQESKALLDNLFDFTKESALRVEQDEKNAENALLLIAVVSLVVGLLSSYLLSSFILKALREATNMASGNLTSEITVRSEDEVGQLLRATNQMRERILAMIHSISSITEQLSAASEELSVVTAQTNHTVQEQRAETEQVASAMTEMSATVQEVSASIQQTANAADGANQQSIQGKDLSTSAVAEINSLVEKLNLAADSIKKVGDSSNEITSILDVIKGVAEQTNLLALNAAIEAARAGEQGRGFAVVADEVRALAARTQQSAQQINEMIGRLQEGTQSAVIAMEQSQDQAKKSVEMASSSNCSLSSIVSVVGTIKDMSNQIASAAEEQNIVIDEISRNLEEINSKSIDTATSAEQTTAASADLARMAAQLKSTVADFTAA